MTKLNFNYDSLQNTVCKNLIATQDNLASTIRTASSLDIPGGFRYASTLNNLGSFLLNKKQIVTEIKLAVDKSNKDYETVERDLLANLFQMKKSNMKDRNSIIIK